MDRLRQLTAAVRGADSARMSILLGEALGDAAMQEMTRALDDAQEGASRLVEVVRDMRTLSRGEAAIAAPGSVSTAARVALRVTSAELRSIAEVDVDVDAALEVDIGTGRLAQVLVNLFSNAAYAMRESCKGPKVAERFVFVTGSAGQAAAAQFLAQVENPVLEKPVAIDALRQAIRALRDR